MMIKLVAADRFYLTVRAASASFASEIQARALL